jgi:hypothetical protein
MIESDLGPVLGAYNEPVKLTERKNHDVLPALKTAAMVFGGCAAFAVVFTTILLWLMEVFEKFYLPQ